ncbi:hypothetical protein DFQ27_001198 [Actinomortierella ambigua]|uniref:Uncharacterized protein n=1 Tax=Actinomortierella ambigua TaxID=1343610 RepID=A0A9P6U8T8_9FUNG|nr:hypothetical protein DFQ27_001198 [Actinomortierella ambigua]
MTYAFDWANRPSLASGTRRRDTLKPDVTIQKYTVETAYAEIKSPRDERNVNLRYEWEGPCYQLNDVPGSGTPCVDRVRNLGGKMVSAVESMKRQFSACSRLDLPRYEPPASASQGTSSTGPKVKNASKQKASKPSSILAINKAK